VAHPPRWTLNNPINAPPTPCRKADHRPEAEPRRVTLVQLSLLLEPVIKVEVRAPVELAGDMR